MAEPFELDGVKYKIETYGHVGKWQVRALRAPDGSLVTATRHGNGPWSLVGTKDPTIGAPRLERAKPPSRRFGR